MATKNEQPPKEDSFENGIPSIIEEKGAVLDTPVNLEANQPEEEPPDGGLRAWLQVAGAFLIFFNIWGLPISFGAFQSFYELQYLKGSSGSNISWIGTLQSFLLVVIGVVCGPLYDLGYYRELVYVGSFLTVFGVMMLSLSTTYWQILLSQGLCAGIGCGLLYVSSLALIGSAFKKNRAFAIGIIMSGVTLGGIVYTIMFQQLIPKVQFGWTVRIMGFTAILTFACGGVLLLWRCPPKKAARARALFDLQALKSPTFLLFSASVFLVFCGYLIPLFYIPVVAHVGLGQTYHFSLWILVITQAASMMGRIVISYTAQKVGSMPSWFFCCTASAILCLAWIGIDNVGGFIAFSALYGFFSSALVSLPPAVFPLVSPDPETLGTRMGMAFTSSAVATLIGAPIAGALTTTTDDGGTNFFGIKIWSGVMLLAGASMLLVLWTTLHRQGVNTRA